MTPRAREGTGGEMFGFDEDHLEYAALKAEIARVEAERARLRGLLGELVAEIDTTVERCACPACGVLVFQAREYPDSTATTVREIASSGPARFKGALPERRAVTVVSDSVMQRLRAALDGDKGEG